MAWDRIRGRRLRLFRIAVSVLVLLVAACGGQDQSFLPGEGSPRFVASFSRPDFTFAVLGDSRDGREIFRELEDGIRSSSPLPEFGFHTGDMISHAGSGIEWYQFHEDAEILTSVMPLYPAIGNHDVEDRDSERTYQHQFGPPISNLYYSFSYSQSLFIVLDTEVADRLGEVSGAQWEWLEQTLALEGASAEHIFVFLHRPLFPVANHRDSSLHPENRDRLHRLFVAERVDAVFAGHEHLYHRQVKEGVTYIITGGGGSRVADHPGGFYHFVYLAVAGPEVYGWAVNLESAIEDSFSFSR